jgi:hypothetical protein
VRAPLPFLLLLLASCAKPGGAGGSPPASGQPGGAPAAAGVPEAGEGGEGKGEPAQGQGGEAGSKKAEIRWHATADGRVIEEPPSRGDRTPIERALDWLAREQSEDGSWTGATGYKLNDRYEVTGRSPHVGVTALAGLAFLSAGHSPAEGKYARVIRRAREFVVSRAQESGYITGFHTRMYSHAFAGMFLAELHARSPDKDLAKILTDAAVLSVSSQGREGGWGYEPFAEGADITVTACILLLLRSAEKAGIRFRNLFDREADFEARALGYARKCLAPEGVKYDLEDCTRATFGTNACGFACLAREGEEGKTLAAEGIRHLVGTYPGKRAKGGCDLCHFFGLFFATLFLHRADGTERDALRERMRREILAEQGEDGAWSDDVGQSYATAMAVLVLEFDRGNLRAFRRG